jgi:hypothetical protein
MPTGYTCGIGDGEIKTGKEFILTCARAFCACIDMRDDPLNKPIPDEFQPHNYHKEQIDSVTKELHKYLNISLEEAQISADKEYFDTYERYLKRNRENIELQHKYETVLKEVRNWQPPTQDHKKLKDFAITQIRESIDFDCGLVYDLTEIKRLSGQEWLLRQIEKCKKDLEYHTKKWDEEVARTMGSDSWARSA